VDVYLVRHAIAAERDPVRWPDDGNRPLTPEGEARFRVAARGLRRIVPSVELVLSSPMVRAWQTAEILVEEAGWPKPHREATLAAGQSATRAVTALRAHSDRQSVAVVGHEPNLSELVGRLVAGPEEGLAIEVKKGGVVCVGLDDSLRANAGWVRWSVTPRILRTLASRPR
jgi:phosphohistidine phosphatase